MKFIANTSDRMVRGAAYGITRRRLIRRAGSVALGTTVAAAYFGRTPTDVAFACETNNPPCYGAPLCGSHRCNGPYCLSNLDHTKYSCYGGGQCCGNSGVQNCWESGGIACCDCCARNPGCTNGQRCTNCPADGTWYTCICRGAWQ